MAKPKALPKLERPPKHCCIVCRADRPVGTMPWIWQVHLIYDDAYIGGSYMVITCSIWCRTQGGYKEERE